MGPGKSFASGCRRTADAAHMTYDTYLKCVLHPALFTVVMPYVHVEAYFISKMGWSRMNPVVSKIGRSAGTGQRRQGPVQTLSLLIFIWFSRS